MIEVADQKININIKESMSCLCSLLSVHYHYITAYNNLQNEAPLRKYHTSLKKDEGWHTAAPFRHSLLRNLPLAFQGTYLSLD